MAEKKTPSMLVAKFIKSSTPHTDNVVGFPHPDHLLHYESQAFPYYLEIIGLDKDVKSDAQGLTEAINDAYGRQVATLLPENHFCLTTGDLRWLRVTKPDRPNVQFIGCAFKPLD